MRLEEDLLRNNPASVVMDVLTSPPPGSALPIPAFPPPLFPPQQKFPLCVEELQCHHQAQAVSQCHLTSLTLQRAVLTRWILCRGSCVGVSWMFAPLRGWVCFSVSFSWTSEVETKPMK